MATFQALSDVLRAAEFDVQTVLLELQEILLV
jgi:hypothetical protein